MKNIVLTGMPACGKSTLGVVLAKTLGMIFVDTDLLIQQHTGELLQKTIDRQGMDGFLKIEEEVISRVEAENAVIATGGSAVYSERGMEHLRSIGTIIYIRLPLEEIKRRLKNIKTRGIAMKPGDSLEQLYEKRVPLYEKYADIIFDTADKTMEESIEAFVRDYSEKMKETAR